MARPGGERESGGAGRAGSAPGRCTVLRGLAVVLALLSGIALGTHLPAVIRWAVPPAHAEIEGSAAVEGTVATDLGHPLPNAHLFLSRVGIQLTAVTDSAGRYRFERVEEGRYVLRVFRLDYRDAERVLDVADGRSVHADFRLEPRRR